MVYIDKLLHNYDNSTTSIKRLTRWLKENEEVGVITCNNPLQFTYMVVTELLAKAFYAWIQVRNMAAVEKVDMDRANKHYERILTRKVFRAWHFSNVSSLHIEFGH